jgi:hypothetical protein
LIFDDPAEQENRQRPVMVRSGRGPVKPARVRRVRAMHVLFFLRKNTKSGARAPRAARAPCASFLPLNSTIYKIGI